MPPALPLADQLLAMASGAWVTQMIHVAAELGLADALAAGERDCDDLAASCGADGDALFRLLRRLAAWGSSRKRHRGALPSPPWRSCWAAITPSRCASSPACLARSTT